MVIQHSARSSRTEPVQTWTPPTGSAAQIDADTWGAPRPRRRWFDNWDPHVRRAAKFLIAVLALTPLFALLARQFPEIIFDPWIMLYGFAVLSSTIYAFVLAYARYEDPAESRHSNHVAPLSFPPLPAVPTVSFLVAIKDERDVIERCVRSMVESDYPGLEVIVVDDASTDGTTEILRHLTTELNFTLIELERNVGKKNALVRGAEVATGEVIAFTDSDCVLAPDALRRCVAALVSEADLGAVSGHARALNADSTLLTKIQDTWYEGSFRVVKAAEASLGSVTCVSGPLAVFRRDAIWNYLPAWANDRFLGGEFKFATDRQLTGYVLGQKWRGRALKEQYPESHFVAAIDYPERKWRVGYVRSAKVWTVVPESPRAFFKQQVRWKKSFIRNLCFSGTFMWRRGLQPSVLYYGHAVWVAAAPLMAIRHMIWAPVNGLWLLTALYLGGIFIKGCAWAVAFAVDNPNSTRWRYRPLMGLISTLCLSWLLPYSLLTIRRNIWSRSL
ncbi:glycosyl transferase [Williamsia sp. 1138]|uniref:glycosyltransferase family 2 protein n=1 Tax=Williamsia sp. 1138 TaxID=1903117 RepID=UPI000A0F89DB|nr:glycosyltransferase [Williamsia sp. 1138]OZG29145.1 glycosyl transferase [Williamsia sp. 1138]